MGRAQVSQSLFSLPCPMFQPRTPTFVSFCSCHKMSDPEMISPSSEKALVPESRNSDWNVLVPTHTHSVLFCTCSLWSVLHMGP